MELHQLRYFVAVAETGSFTKAAERCLVAQPSLSQQIQKLERSLRHPLFDRLGRKVTLTDAGRSLLSRAQTILASVEEAERSLKEGMNPGEGRVTIGAIPTIGPFLLPQALSRFARRYPDVEIDVREDLTAHLLEQIVAGDLDFAVMALPVQEDRVFVDVLCEEPLFVAMPAQHRLARKRTLRFADLRDERFILLSEMHCLGEQVANVCRQQAFPPKLTCRSVQLSTVQTLIGLGLGISLLPAMARWADSGRKRIYRELADEKPSRTIVVVRHKHRFQTPTARLFCEMIRSQAAERNPNES